MQTFLGRVRIHQSLQVPQQRNVRPRDANQEQERQTHVRRLLERELRLLDLPGVVVRRLDFKFLAEYSLPSRHQIQCLEGVHTQRRDVPLPNLCRPSESERNSNRRRLQVKQQNDFPGEVNDGAASLLV